jgi:exodeoxyribonuclease III
MKIVSWNVNSVRARFERLLEFLKAEQPDVLCLQELKCTDEQFPKLEINALGYECETFGQKSYNGVAILSKYALSEVTRSLGDDDDQARIMGATANGFRVVSLYAPNGQSLESEAYGYKLEWYKRLTRVLPKEPTRPLVVTGDFNIAPADGDTWNVALWKGQTLASPPERAALDLLMREHELSDLFREKYPDVSDKFSWFDYRAGAFHKNQGLRIDLTLGNVAAKNCFKDAGMLREYRKGKLPSDHVPIWAQFEFAI